MTYRFAMLKRRAPRKERYIILAFDSGGICRFGYDWRDRTWNDLVSKTPLEEWTGWHVGEPISEERLFLYLI